MKTLVVACLVSVLGMVAARADLTVVQTVAGFGPDVENTSKFKAGKMRVDTSPGTSIIIDLRSGEMINLMHAAKKYVKVASSMTRAAVDGMKPDEGKPGDAKPSLTATGRKETVSGFPAEEYTCTIAKVKMTLWLTTALPGYEAALKEMNGALSQGVMGPLMQGDGLDLTNLPGFPVRTVLEIQPGQVMTRTVVSVNAQPIADEEFAIPADYKEMIVPVLTPPAAVTGPSLPPAVSH